MANTTATKKSIRKTERRTAVNKNIKNRVRTFIKKTEKLIEEGDKKSANDSLRATQSEMMKAVRKGVFKLNTSSRKISRLSARIKSIA
jgi:small subunit ribosomal protein S20